MVSIDTVYQKVLAIANKEQRGYITPQEFNLFANQAQIEIFEQYFYDLNQFQRVHGNDTNYADVDNMLEEKLQIFERLDTGPVISNNAIYIPTGTGLTLPNYIYRVSMVEFQNRQCEMLNTKEFNSVTKGTPLITPSADRPVFNIMGNIINWANGPSVLSPSSIFYFKIPDKVEWGYLVVGEKALFDSNPQKTTHFELHPSEQSELVYKILKFAGVSMKRDDVMRAGQGMESQQVQQEKQ